MIIFEDSHVIVATSGMADGPMGSTTNGGPEENWRGNRQRFFESLGLDPARIIGLGLVHGRRVAQPDDVDKAEGRIPDCDGAVWLRGGASRGVYVCHSDCIAGVVVGDGVLGICHAGWRGLLGGIVQETIHVADNSAPRDVKLFTSPFIQRCCFEVGNDREGGVPMYEANCLARYVYQVQGKPHVDLAGILHEQCVNKGMSWRNVEISLKCTYCAKISADAHLLWSSRRLRHDGANPAGRNNVTVAAFKR